MELETALRSRRSIRKYLSAHVPDDLIKDLLDLSRHAPSSMNGQPCSFIVVRDQVIRNRLADIKDGYCPPEKKHYPAGMLRSAPVVIIVCVDRLTAHERVIENAVLAAAQFMLAAHDKGLGTVFMTAYRDNEPEVTEEIRKLLTIPTSIDPVIILPLGYPDELPVEKPLKPLETLIFYEQFGRL